MFVVTNKKTKKVLAKGTMKEVAYKLDVTESTIREHYMDRDNKNRFVNCDYRVDKEDDNRKHNNK